jgi:hypothetical protein
MSKDSIPDMTDAEFNAALDTATDYGRNLLAQGVSSVLPTLIVHRWDLQEKQPAKPLVDVYVLHNFDMAARHESLASIGRKLGSEATLLHCAFFVSEAWLSKQEAGKPRQYALPENDPNREEVMIIAGMAIDGRTAAARIALTRDTNGHFVLGAVNGMPYGRGGDVQMNARIMVSFFQGYAMGVKALLGAIETEVEKP